MALPIGSLTERTARPSSTPLKIVGSATVSVRREILEGLLSVAVSGAVI
jgi:hypothetical protein